jgi:hypothetical protein
VIENRADQVQFLVDGRRFEAGSQSPILLTSEGLGAHLVEGEGCQGIVFQCVEVQGFAVGAAFEWNHCLAVAGEKFAGAGVPRMPTSTNRPMSIADLMEHARALAARWVAKEAVCMG